MNTLTGFKGLTVTAVFLALVGWEGKTPAAHVKQSSVDEMLSLKKRLDKATHSLNTIVVQTAHGELAAKSAPYYPKKKKMFLSLQALYWKANEEGLDYAAHIQEKGSLNNIQEHIIQPHYKWSPGFRVGVGGFFYEHDQWDLYLNWTSFYNKAQSSVGNSNANNNDYIVASWFGPNSEGVPGIMSSGNVLNAKGTWTLRFNTIDLELGRHYFISRAFSARPYFGVRGAIIDQRYKASYTGIFDLTQSSTATAGTSMKAKNDFWGVGPRLGADFIWHLGSHWGISGKISAALLGGQFQVKQTYDGDEVSNGALAPLDVKSNKNYDRARANIETGAGIQWDTGFDKERQHVTVGLQYEFAEWFRQNMLVRAPQETTDQGNLGLQGLSFNIRFDF